MLIAYTTPFPSLQRKIHRKLYGYIDHSKNGKYRYERKGLLSIINHVKINKATIQTSKDQAILIINLLNKLGVNYKTYP